MNQRLNDAFSSAAGIEVGAHIGIGIDALLVGGIAPPALVVLEILTAVAAAGKGAYVYCHPKPRTT